MGNVILSWIAEIHFFVFKSIELFQIVGHLAPWQDKADSECSASEDNHENTKDRKVTKDDNTKIVVKYM